MRGINAQQCAEQSVMDAQLMRCLGGNLFCVALRDTSAVVCIETASACPGLLSAGPFSPVDVKVELGEYQVQQGVYKGCSIVAPRMSACQAKTTSYKKIRL